MKAEPQKEHQWLQKLVGEWWFEADSSMGPGQPPTRTHGSETVRSVGGLWTVAEGQGEVPSGGTATSIMTLGYDPQRQRFVGTWVGSIMAHLWTYDGTLDDAGRVLTLDTEGPHFSGGHKRARYQDVIEFKSDDHRVMTSRMLADDGTWHDFMTAHYRKWS
jgi:Protein of unknown function (DUF1579)